MTKIPENAHPNVHNNPFSRPDVITEPLHVITVVFNPIRFRTRWNLYKKFEKHCKDAGATLYTVEVAFGQRAFSVTEPGNPYHIQLRSSTELWLKENMINIAISRLPLDWQYVAWVDADVYFVRPDWVGETLHQLQHYKIVQMFSEAQDLGPNYEPFMRHQSFAYSYYNNIPQPKLPGYYFPKEAPRDIITWHPGFAWAIRREAFDQIGGLIDFAILGAGDNHMAKALVGDGLYSIHPDVTQGYKDAILEWQERALKYIRKNIGYVEGLILHAWHGRKSDRRYWDRWKILVEGKFDPYTDLKKDWQNLYQLVDKGDNRHIFLRDKIMEYFRNRSEDDIYLPDTEDHM